MVIWALLLTFIVLLITAIFLFKKELMQPSIIMLSMYVFSIICAAINIERWEMDLSWELYGILTGGALLFMTVNLMVNWLYKKRKGKKELTTELTDKQKKKIFSPIIIGKWKIYVLVLFDIVTLVLTVTSVLNIAGQFGDYSNYSEALNLYKANVSYSHNATMPDYVNWMMRIVMAGGYICLVFFVHNVVFSEQKIWERIKNNFLYLLPVICLVVRYLLVSNRGDILRLVIGAISLGLIFWFCKGRWKKYIKPKTLIKMAVIIVIGLVVFYASSTLVGRNVKDNKGLVNYTTMYVGGSIYNFDSYLKDPVGEKYFGVETFPDLVSKLNELGVIDLGGVEYTQHLEHRYAPNGLHTGNVFTAFRRWLHDFGVGGMIILQTLMALFFAWIYNFLKYNWKKQSDLYMLVAVLFAITEYYLFLHSIDGIFFNLVISISFVIQIAIIVIGYFVLRYWKKDSKVDESKTSQERLDEKI